MGFGLPEPEGDRWLDRYFELIDQVGLFLALLGWAPVLYRSAKNEGQTSSVVILDRSIRSSFRRLDI